MSREKGYKNKIKNASAIIKNSERKSKELKCSICLMEYTGYGHNATPINEGRCCEQCNSSNVIPARVFEIFKEINER